MRRVAIISETERGAPTILVLPERAVTAKSARWYRQMIAAEFIKAPEHTAIQIHVRHQQPARVALGQLAVLAPQQIALGFTKGIIPTATQIRVCRLCRLVLAVVSARSMGVVGSF